MYRHKHQIRSEMDGLYRTATASTDDTTDLAPTNSPIPCRASGTRRHPAETTQ